MNIKININQNIHDSNPKISNILHQFTKSVRLPLTTPGLRLASPELQLHGAKGHGADWVALAAQLGGGLGAYTVSWRSGDGGTCWYSSNYFKIIIIVIILGDLLKICVNHVVICNHRNQ